jgi:hypothetical protein
MFPNLQFLTCSLKRSTEEDSIKITKQFLQKRMKIIATENPDHNYENRNSMCNYLTH